MIGQLRSVLAISVLIGVPLGCAGAVVWWLCELAGLA